MGNHQILVSCRATKTPVHCWWDSKKVQYFFSWHLLLKSNMHVSYNPREIKTHIHTKVCLHANSFTHNSQKLEITQLPSN